MRYRSITPEWPPAAQEFFCAGDRTLRAARALMAELLGPVHERNFAVRYWDGTVIAPPSSEAPAFTLVVRDAAALRRMFVPPIERHVGEAYVRGDLDVEGDIEAATGIAEIVHRSLAGHGALRRIASRLLAVPVPPRQRMALNARLSRNERRSAPHSVRRATAASRSHYDVGNDFYALWLDDRMVYSCAYFESQSSELDDAQEAKLDLICRKLRLARGERFLDIGCGWGGLVRHAAKHYGARAVGVTLSNAQAALASERIGAEGLSDRCAVLVADYSDASAMGLFDKIASVGMFEHVGPAQLEKYFGTVYRLLRPGGLFLNHGIVTHPRGSPRVSEQRGMSGALRRMVWGGGQFIDRYVFPDGQLSTLGQVVVRGESSGFEVRDVESLREHYVLTLRCWLRRLEKASAEARRTVGDELYRIWRLYLAASARAFASRRIGITQTLFAKPDANGSVGLPLTREHLFHRPTGM